MPRAGDRGEEGDEPDSPHVVTPQTVDFAREIALRALTVRGRSRHELEGILAKKKVPAEVIAQVLDRLAEVALVDDRSFATAWIESGRQRSKSRRSLMVELDRLGVDREVSLEALEPVDGEAELEAALQLAAKKARSLRALEPVVARRRLAGALARRGFPAGVVASAVRRTMQGWAESSDSDGEWPNERDFEGD